MSNVQLPKKLGKDYYRFQRKDAAHRGIEFLLTYDEWLKIWIDSGHANQKGCRRGQYVMARFGDKGPYAVGNVRICTVAENSAELWARAEFMDKMKATHTGKYVSPETRKKLRESRLGTKLPLAVRQKMGESRKGNKNALGHKPWLGRKHTDATKEKIRQFNLGKIASPAARAKMSVRLIGNQYALGLVHSEKSRKQMSEAHKKRWARIKAEKQSELHA